MKKRWLSLMLAVLMLALTVPTSVFSVWAEEADATELLTESFVGELSQDFTGKSFAETDINKSVLTFAVWYKADGSKQLGVGSVLADDDYLVINPKLFEDGVLAQGDTLDVMLEKYSTYLMDMAKVNYIGNWSMGYMIGGEYYQFDSRSVLTDNSTLFNIRKTGGGDLVVGMYNGSYWTGESVNLNTYYKTMVENGKSIIAGLEVTGGKKTFAEIMAVVGDNPNSLGAGAYQWGGKYSGGAVQSNQYLRPGAEHNATVGYGYTVPENAGGKATLQLDKLTVGSEKGPAYMAVAVNGQVVWPAGADATISDQWAVFSESTFDAIKEEVSALEFDLQSGDMLQVLFARKEKMMLDLDLTVSIEKQAAGGRVFETSSFTGKEGIQSPALVDVNALNGLIEPFVRWYHEDGSTNTNEMPMQDSDYAMINPALITAGVFTAEDDLNTKLEKYGAYLMDAVRLTYTGDWSMGYIYDGTYKRYDSRAILCEQATLFGLRVKSTGAYIPYRWGGAYWTDEATNLEYYYEMVAAGLDVVAGMFTAENAGVCTWAEFKGNNPEVYDPALADELMEWAVRREILLQKKSAGTLTDAEKAELAEIENLHKNGGKYASLVSSLSNMVKPYLAPAFLHTQEKGGTARQVGASDLYLRPGVDNSVACYAYTVPAGVYGDLALVLDGIEFADNETGPAYFCVAVNQQAVWPETATIDSPATWGSLSKSGLNSLNNQLANVRIAVAAGDTVQICISRKDKIAVQLDMTVSIEKDVVVEYLDKDGNLLTQTTSEIGAPLPAAPYNTAAGFIVNGVEADVLPETITEGSYTIQYKGDFLIKPVSVAAQSITLDDNFGLNLYLAADSCAVKVGAYVGTDATETFAEKRDDGTYKIVVTDSILPDELDKGISLYLFQEFVDGESSMVSTPITVVPEDVLKTYTTDTQYADVKPVAEAALNYAAAVRAYLGGTALDDATKTALAAYDAAIEALSTAVAVEEAPGVEYTIKGANLVLLDRVSIKLYATLTPLDIIEAEDLETLSVLVETEKNGRRKTYMTKTGFEFREGSDNTEAVITLDGMVPKDFDEVLYITLIDDEEDIVSETRVYSINTYIARSFNGGNTEIADVLRAMYAYGAAVEAMK